MEGETSGSSSQVRSVMPMPCHGGKAEAEKRRKRVMAQPISSLFAKKAIPPPPGNPHRGMTYAMHVQMGTNAYDGRYEVSLCNGAHASLKEN